MRAHPAGRATAAATPADAVAVVDHMPSNKHRYPPRDAAIQSPQATHPEPTRRSVASDDCNRAHDDRSASLRSGRRYAASCYYCEDDADGDDDDDDVDDYDDDDDYDVDADAVVLFRCWPRNFAFSACV